MGDDPGRISNREHPMWNFEVNRPSFIIPCSLFDMQFGG